MEHLLINNLQNSFALWACINIIDNKGAIVPTLYNRYELLSMFLRQRERERERERERDE
jgi:hypothetical protein